MSINPIAKSGLAMLALSISLYQPGMAQPPAQTKTDPFVEAILQKYGIEAFKKAKEIHFTFHAKTLGVGPSHAWIWYPQSDSVACVDDGISYSRKSMNEKQKSIDAKFINDMYWLSFPLHLAMDKGIQVVVDTGLTASPKKKEKLRRVSVTYMQKEGYTPNDSYELFVAPDGLIKEWIYHRHGGKRGAAWTWENQNAYSGVLFAQDHHGIVHISFSDISVL
jgi:hypothetical protein